MEDVRAQLAEFGLPGPGETFAAKYRVDRLLGVGGMGVVIAATHVHLDQRVAIKVLLPEVAKNAAMVARFTREGRAAAKIKSEHVAKVYDVGQLDSGGVYLVMEYLEGTDLAALCDGRQLPVTDAVDYVLQACEALADAHAEGIVHRDLKPANLFLVRQRDGSPCVKVLDFGISKLALAEGDPASVRLTRTQDLAGSPLYMSPEQLRSLRDVDARTDVWSLGVLFFELLAGKPPFDGSSAHVVSAAILKDPTPKLPRADVPEGLQEVIDACLEKEPDRRTPSVAVLAEDLHRFASPVGKVAVERIRRVAGTPPQAQAARILGSARIDATGPTISATGPTISVTGATIAATTSSGVAPVAGRSRSSPLPWIAAIICLLGVGGFFGVRAMRTTAATAPSTTPSAPIQPPVVESATASVAASATVIAPASSPPAASTSAPSPQPKPSVGKTIVKKPVTTAQTASAAPPKPTATTGLATDRKD